MRTHTLAAICLIIIACAGPSAAQVEIVAQILVQNAANRTAGVVVQQQIQAAIAPDAGQVLQYDEYNETVSPDACVPGFYCVGNFAPPQPCPAGTYTPFGLETSAGDCTPCPPGGYCYAGSAAPVNCTAGTASNATRAQTSAACAPCAAGRYCPADGMTAGTPCPLGNYSLPGATQCSPCQPGYYCPAGLQVACPGGTYQPGPGASAASSCLPCPAGQYCPAASSAPTPCPAGTYSRVNTSALGLCLPCPAGEFCPVGTSAPSNCSGGTYRSTTGGGSSSDCTGCAPGTFSTLSGATTACPPCPAGYYCTSPGVIAACPAYTMSPSGTQSQLSCVCYPGFTCRYTKRLKVVVTLANLTAADFQNNTGGCRDAFIAAVAAASGVPISAVSITNVAVGGGGRRLLAEGHGGAVVTCTVRGGTTLSGLPGHLLRAGGLTWSSHESIPVHTVAPRRTLISGVLEKR